MKATIKTIDTLVKLGFRDITDGDEKTYSFHKAYKKEEIEYGFCIVEFDKKDGTLEDEIENVTFHCGLKPFQDVSPMIACFYEFQKDMEEINGTIAD